MFGSGVAMVEARKARHCVARYVLARFVLDEFGICNDLEASLITLSELAGSYIASIYTMAFIDYAHHPPWRSAFAPRQ